MMEAQAMESSNIGFTLLRLIESLPMCLWESNSTSLSLFPHLWNGIISNFHLTGVLFELNEVMLIHCLPQFLENIKNSINYSSWFMFPKNLFLIEEKRGAILWYVKIMYNGEYLLLFRKNSHHNPAHHIHHFSK